MEPLVRVLQGPKERGDSNTELFLLLSRRWSPYPLLWCMPRRLWFWKVLPHLSEEETVLGGGYLSKGVPLAIDKRVPGPWSRLGCPGAGGGGPLLSC